MNYQAVFKGWEQLTISDLIVAYRKAKADCFFENSFPTAIKFAEYELSLITNLESLLNRLKLNNGINAKDNLLGSCRIVPKKIACDLKEGNAKNGHTHFSNNKKAFEHLCKHNDLTPEFRVVGDFPVDTHIISALWINMVGHKFDACLNDKDIYGSRLKRVRSDDLSDTAPKNFHLTAVGSFQPYFQPYQKWRSDGLTAIRTEIEQGRSVVAVSLDLKTYYHRIDPGFIAEKKFQEEIGLAGINILTDAEQLFTQQMADFLCAWSDHAKIFARDLQNNESETVYGGLVIGLTASRIISNVLLYKWDKLVREKLTPVHYGRYVDDMFLVMLDGGSIADTTSFMSFLEFCLPEIMRGPDATLANTETNKTPWQIDLGKQYQKESVIQLQPNKQKLFLLDGKAGLDLVDSIEHEINKLSSERRLMPTPDQLEKTIAAKVLSASDDGSESADTLRRADELTIHRLSWSLQLSHVETLAHDLPASEWKNERTEFYEFAHNHVLRPEKIFAHYQYLPRLLSFAISLQEWHEAERIVRASLDAMKILAEKCKPIGTINGKDSCRINEKSWRCIQESLVWSFIDAAARSYPQSLFVEKNPNSKIARLAKLFVDLLLKEIIALDQLWDVFTYGNFLTIAPQIALSDLAKVPYKTMHRNNDSFIQSFFLADLSRKNQTDIYNAFEHIGLVSIENIAEFLRKTQNNRFNSLAEFEPISPFLFPTRPFTPEEISELAPECIGSLDGVSAIQPAALWATYVHALRGTWVSPILLEAQQIESSVTKEKTCLRIGTKSKKSVYVAITNLATEEDSWEKTACNKPDLSLERYKRICNIVNLAITSKPKPDYVLLPELSLPLKWVDGIANRLRGAGINLIAGTEYRHNTKNNSLFSEACLVMSDHRLGYPASVRIWQPKLEPAVGEDERLTTDIGKQWKIFTTKEKLKPIYNHDGFNFGVMICSELQNSKDRIDFQGEVDALMVLAWNRDLDTFSALVEASALDIHAYIILVNNRLYGDSRVRSPAKESFLRDLARLRGGRNDYCVTVEIDIEKLRYFQSRAKRWVRSDDPFKPVPEGFEITRRKLMPKH